MLDKLSVAFLIRLSIFILLSILKVRVCQSKENVLSTCTNIFENILKVVP